MEIKRVIADKEVNTNFAEEIDDNVSVECRSIKPAPSDSWKCTASSDAAEDKLTVTLIVIYEYSRLKKKKAAVEFAQQIHVSCAANISITLGCRSKWDELEIFSNRCNFFYLSPRVPFTCFSSIQYVRSWYSSLTREVSM